MASLDDHNQSGFARIKITPLKDKQGYPKWAVDVKEELKRLHVWDIVFGDIECPIEAQKTTQSDQAYKTYVNGQKLINDAF
jgi:hypothetical protein